VSREARRQRLALEECDHLIEAALHDLDLTRIGLECVRGEVRDALNPPDPDPDRPVTIGFLIRQRDGERTPIPEWLL
jgi:hypothetical protein